MIGTGLLFLCLLVVWRLIRNGLHRPAVSLFFIVVGTVAIASLTHASTKEKQHGHERAELHQPDTLVSECQNISNGVTACTKAIESGNWQPTDLAWAFNNRGLAYATQGRMLKALSDYSQAIALSPLDAAAWSNRGNAYAFLGDLLKAFRDHEQALELAPDRATSWHNRGVDFEEMGQYERALSDYRSALDLDPDHRAAHLGLATANCKLSRVKASAQARLKMVEKGLLSAIDLQTILKNEGFYRGPLDGKFGKGSRAALWAWTRAGCLAHA